jgi:hypothetical protein
MKGYGSGAPTAITSVRGSANVLTTQHAAQAAAQAAASAATVATYA